MSDSSRTKTFNTFTEGMWQDSLLSLQPKGTYREAWSAVLASEEANSFGVTNELSNELFVAIPEKFDVRGIIYAEERNQYVVFLHDFKANFSEIGILDELSKSYIKKLNDTDLGGKLCFGNEFNNLTLKTTGQCNPLEVYWSNKDTYYYVDLDDKHICFKKLEDLELFKCDCGPQIHTFVLENGGKLPNGIYQFFFGLEDEEGNDTNFFAIGNPVSIGDGDFVAGELSNSAIHITLDAFKSRYPKIRLGVVKTIAGKYSVDIITTSYHGNGNFNYVYSSIDQVEREATLTEILTKKDGYIKGKNLTQYDGRLLLYNIRGKKNLDYQRRANTIKASYRKYRVPIKYAHQFKGLRPWEKYQFGIHFNYCDGTKTPNYIIPGRDCIDTDLVKVPVGDDSNCSLCELPRWRIEDTSFRTDLFGEDSKTKSKKSKQIPTGIDDGYSLDDRKPPKYDDPDTGDEKDEDDLLDCECNLFFENLGVLVFKCEDCFIAHTLLIPGVIEKLCMCKSRGGGTGTGGDGEGGGTIILDGTEIFDIGFTEDQMAEILASPTILERVKSTLSCSNCAASSTSYTTCGSCGGSGTCYECNGDGQCHSGACGHVDECNQDDSQCGTCGGSGSCTSCSGLGKAKDASWFEVVKRAEEDLLILKSDSTVINGHRATKTGDECDCEGTTKCFYGICTTCKDGMWYLLDHVDPVRYAQSYTRDARPFESPTIAEPISLCSPITIDTTLNVCKKGSDGWSFTVSSATVSKITGTLITPSGTLPLSGVNTNTLHGSLLLSSFNTGDPYEITFNYVITLPDGCKYTNSTSISAVVGKPLLCDVNLSETISPDDPNGGNGSGGNGGGGGTAEGPCNDLQFEYIYDEDGCEILGVKPLKYAQGEFGFWQLEETYPLTKDCDGKYIYGELAGQRVRLCAVPGNNKEPHFLSCQNGVPSDLDPSNDEYDNTYIDFVGVAFEGIVLPKDEELSKPLCPNNPFTITMVPRTEADTSVLSSGLFINTFLGNIQAEPSAFAKHAVNSCEYYDRSIDPFGDSSFRGGREMDKPVYIHHSPDLHLLKRNVGDAYNIVFDLEFGGWGYMYHHYYKGDAPESPSVGRRNQKGVTQNIHLNHYDNPVINTGIIRCVKGMEYVKADSVVAKGDIFSYDLINLWRESAVYVELEGSVIPMVNSIEKFAPGTQYGGANPVEDNTSDASFLGYGMVHEGPIFHANAHFGHTLRYLPHQYGNPVSQTYEPLMQGSASDAACGKIEGLAGDSFCNAFHVKRTGVVSDKVPSDISPAVPVTGGPTFRFLKKILKGIFNSIGVEYCGTVPESAQSDIRHNVSLRAGRWSVPTNPQTPIPAVPNPTGSDIFYPSVLKTNITTYIPSDVNTHFRQTGLEAEGKIHYKHLKSYKLDSAFPQGTPAERAYLDRFYVESNENPVYKMIIRIIINFLFTYGIGLWVMIKGLAMLGGGSFGLQTAFALAVIFIGILWIKYWVSVDWDNRLFDRVIGIDGCWPDFKLRDGSYKMRDGRIRGFEDNFWGYNLDYSKTNFAETSLGLPDPYNTCDCLGDYKSLLLYSAKQRIGSPVNSWINFKINDYDEIPTDRGNMTDVFQLGNKAFIHTSDAIIDLMSGNSELSLGDRNTIYLSNGDLFRDAIAIGGGVVEGMAGNLDPNAAITTEYGHFFIDRKSKAIYQFTGDSPKKISDLGLRHFLHKNLGFFLLDQFPEFKNVDNKHDNGIGYSLGVDHKLNRLLITKIDYKAYDPEDLTLDSTKTIFKHKSGKTVSIHDEDYFCNKSFTVSFDLVKNRWVGFHYYQPKLYAWNRFDMYSFNKEGMWKHNIDGNHSTFYGEYFPFSIEYVITDSETFDAFSFVGSKVDVEVNEFVDYDYIRSSHLFFDKLLAYNSYQSTGEVTFRDKSKEDIISASSYQKDTVRTSFTLRKWAFDGLKDKLASVSEHILDNDCVIGPRPVNKNNILSDSKNNKFVDNYLVNRLTFSKFDPESPLQINLKSIESEIEREIS